MDGYVIYRKPSLTTCSCLSLYMYMYLCNIKQQQQEQQEEQKEQIKRDVFNITYNIRVGPPIGPNLATSKMKAGINHTCLQLSMYLYSLAVIVLSNNKIRL